MYKGEACHLHMAPRFGYGESGLKPGDSLGLIGEADGTKYDGSVIGPDTWLEAKLELHDWSEEPEHETLSIAERMEIGYVLTLIAFCVKIYKMYKFLV